METLGKFFRFPSAQRLLIVTSVLLLWMIRLGLWLLPFLSLQRLLARMVQGVPERPEADLAAIARISWAVTVASRCVPDATCLTQALATQMLLARRGHATCLRLGVTRSDSGQFQAHAWVEYQDRVIIGGVDAPRRFTPLPPLEGKTG